MSELFLLARSVKRDGEYIHTSRVIAGQLTIKGGNIIFNGAHGGRHYTHRAGLPLPPPGVLNNQFVAANAAARGFRERVCARFNGTAECDDSADDD